MRIDETVVDDTLRRAKVICISFAASAGLYALLIYLLVEHPGEGSWSEAPGTVPFVLALGAMMLLFVSGAARSRVLRKAAEVDEDGTIRVLPAAELAAVFFRATLICFALAEGAAVLGLASALLGKSSFYGLVICAASLYVMIARWPRRSSFEAFLDGDRREETYDGR